MLKDKELESMWLRELRSGTPQTRSVLRNEEGECCLGVLARVAGIPLTADGRACKDGQNRSSYVPLQRLFVNSKDLQKCYHMNDSERKTFPEIADVVEGER